MHHPTDILGAYLNGALTITIAAGVLWPADRSPGFAQRTVVPTTLTSPVP